MRLSCLTVRAERKLSLGGSLPGPPLTTADPGRAPVQLGWKAQKPDRHPSFKQHPNLPPKSTGKLLACPSFFSALVFGEKKKVEIMEYNQVVAQPFNV